MDVDGRVRPMESALRTVASAETAHAEHHDLAAVLLPESQGLLDGVFVDRVEDRLDRLAVERLVRRVGRFSAAGSGTRLTVTRISTLPPGVAGGRTVSGPPTSMPQRTDPVRAPSGHPPGPRMSARGP